MAGPCFWESQKMKKQQTNVHELTQAVRETKIAAEQIKLTQIIEKKKATDILIDIKVRKLAVLQEAYNKTLRNLKSEIVSNKTGFSASDFFDDWGDFRPVEASHMFMII